MGYVEQALIPGEQVILKARLHWAIFVTPAIVAALGFLLFVVFVLDSEFTLNGLLCLAFFFLLVMPYIFRTVVSYFTTEFAVTDKRVIAKTGLLRRRSLELLLSKVESIGVNQPIMGRIFDYGTIVVVGTGGTKEGFPYIEGPMNFRKRINTLIEEPKR